MNEKIQKKIVKKILKEIEKKENTIVLNKVEKNYLKAYLNYLLIDLEEIETYDNTSDKTENKY